MKAIKQFFFPNTPAKQFADEFRALTDEDKAQLQGGIEDGSLTY